MKRALVSALALASAVALAKAGGWTTIVDTGFEDYSLGFIDGQHGWTGYAGSSSIAPTVIDSTSGPVLGGKAVAINVGNIQGGGYCFLGIDFSDLLSGGYTQIQISYDIYRDLDAYDQNLRWYMPDEGIPNGGIQDYLKGTRPLGYSSSGGTVATVFGAYTHVELTWDLSLGKAYSKYNGAIVDDGINLVYLDSETGWNFYLSHDGPGTNFGDTAYLDNFKVLAGNGVPEPATLVVVGAGLLAITRRKRQR